MHYSSLGLLTKNLSNKYQINLNKYFVRKNMYAKIPLHINFALHRCFNINLLSLTKAENLSNYRKVVPIYSRIYFYLSRFHKIDHKILLRGA